MDYAEASYFDGAHFAHIAAWREYERILRIEARCGAMTRQDDYADARVSAIQFEQLLMARSNDIS